MVHCHCGVCRKAHGAAFATYINVEDDAFEWITGVEHVTAYESSAGFLRAFCDVCGSVVPSQHVAGRYSMAAGSMDASLDGVEQAHIFVNDRLSWIEIDNSLDQHEAYPPSFDRPVLESLNRAQAHSDRLAGSCLCGDVTFEVSGAVENAHNCHCQRCRKAYGAAHSSFGFTGADKIRFISGESQIQFFKLPEAQVFATAFCRRCGSGVPVCESRRNFAIVPLAALDDAPATGPVDHIYVGSKADWYRICDQLPQLDDGLA